MSIFDKWDNEIDTEGLAKDVAEAAENGGNRTFEKVPFGDYEVAIDNMELKESSKGDPMVSIWFKIVDGQHKNQLIFFNQVITQGFQVHIVNELLRKMVSEMQDAPAIEFKSYKQYANLLLDVHEKVVDGFEYVLAYSQGKPNKKGQSFDKYEIKEVFVLE